MLLRISLIVAIIAALAAGALSYVAVTDKIPALTTQRDQEQKLRKDTQATLAKTEKELGKTKSDLAQTKQELSDTKSERDKALVKVEQLQKQSDQLSDKLAKATRERDDAQNELASFKATGLTPDQVAKLNKMLKDARTEIEVVNDEKTLLIKKVDKLQAQINYLIGTNSYVLLRPDLRGEILVVDPKWDFVILNVGENQGVLPEGELLVSRSGKLVAKVVVRTVQKDRCIANVVPGWKLGEPLEGDVVTPAHPAS
jgi:septal ring factor EnvC (AmiA/AmiB activator)